MIRSFANVETERLFITGRSRRLAAVVVERTKRKLQILDSATDLRDLASPPGNRLEALRGERDSTAFALTINFASAFAGKTATSTTWKLWIITENCDER